MAIYLSTYHPLVRSLRGKAIIERHRLPPYVDDSIRREPDLESRYPSITAICHGKGFAPRLHVGDLAVYMTKKDRYPGGSEPDHRLVAILEVIERFESHEDAAHWYRDRGLRLPSNCMVEGNPPLRRTLAGQRKDCKDDASCTGWDRDYQERARRWGTFLACESCFLDMQTPPSISDGLLIHVFGAIPGTRTPKRITQKQYEALIRGCGAAVPSVLG